MPLLLECIQDGICLLISFKGGDQVAFLVIQGEIGQIADLIKRGQEEFFVSAYDDIRVLEKTVMGIEVLHFSERLISSHYDLDVFEFIEIGQDGFRLVLAMVAVRTEEHDDRPAMFF